MFEAALTRKRKKRQAEKCEYAQTLLEETKRYKDETLTKAAQNAIDMLNRYETMVCELEERLFR